MFSSRERGEGGAAIAELKVHPSSNYHFQGCASLTLSPRPELPNNSLSWGDHVDGSSHLHAQRGRASPLRSEGGSVVWGLWRRPPALPAAPHRGVWGVPWQSQSWLSVPPHPSQHRQPLSRGAARREERKGTESRGGRGGVKEANKKNKTTERLLHSPRLNYKPVY